ncbi:MAG: hypothetical protein JOZ29_02590 [Deltaproteobacteria bacterium]|nr:hypothetical protein [Deltaproteobacteria bacterium]
MRCAEHDWIRFDAMTEEQRHAAALVDPDATAKAYLVVIVHELEVVRRALETPAPE